jgi:hypothetical protein
MLVLNDVPPLLRNDVRNVVGRQIEIENAISVRGP